MVILAFWPLYEYAIADTVSVFSWVAMGIAIATIIFNITWLWRTRDAK